MVGKERASLYHMTQVVNGAIPNNKDMNKRSIRTRPPKLIGKM